MLLSILVLILAVDTHAENHEGFFFRWVAKYAIHSFTDLQSELHIGVK